MKTLSFRVWTLLALILTTIGCQKDDLETFSKKSKNHELFFNNISWLQKQFPTLQVHQTENRTVGFSEHLRAIQSKLRELDNTHGIIDRIIDRYGMPVWGRPLVPEAVGNAQYVYYFPLLHGSNELVNGVLKVTLNSEGQFHFYIISEDQLFYKIGQNKDAEDILNNISVFSELGLTLLSKTRLVFQQGIHYFFHNGDDRIQLRKDGCWDDKVITFIDFNDSDITRSTATGAAFWNNDVSQQVGYQPHENGRIIYFPNINLPQGGFIIHTFSVRYWDPDCFRNSNSGNWFDENEYPNGGGAASNTNITPWMRLANELQPWIEYCQNYAPDPTGNIDNVSTDPVFDQKRESICRRVNLIMNITGLNPVYYLDLLVALEMYLITEADIIGIIKKHNGQPYLDEAIQKYIQHITNTSFPALTLPQFMDAYAIIHNWMASHNNDGISILIGTHAISMLFQNGSNTNGSGPLVNVLELESRYIHEELKHNYPDYNNDIDNFLYLYGPDKYIYFTEYYKEMKNKGVAVLWLDILEGLSWENDLGEEAEIQNVIQIQSITVLAVGIIPGPKICETEYRHPHNPPAIIAPDMKSGANANLSLLASKHSGLPNLTVDQLRWYMNELILWASSGALETEAQYFIERFLST